ncbi:hypothetical protein OPV22_032223 [Ensete ventricosum]|uniref:Uncharacterized protein n=1 Tax=Ensete ventricosum TaxID=4639 RepID=A0AAV8PW01_ENSVE|nr:hypothetical protein OPV22_032223 [Ensete ventricosum]
MDITANVLGAFKDGPFRGYMQAESNPPPKLNPPLSLSVSLARSRRYARTGGRPNLPALLKATETETVVKRGAVLSSIEDNWKERIANSSAWPLEKEQIKDWVTETSA